MTTYRITSSSAATGAYEHTAAAPTARAAHEHCAAAWRAGSVHVVEAFAHPGVPPRTVAVYAAARRVHPLLPWAGESAP